MKNNEAYWARAWLPMMPLITTAPTLTGSPPRYSVQSFWSSGFHDNGHLLKKKENDCNYSFWLCSILVATSVTRRLAHVHMADIA